MQVKVPPDLYGFALLGCPLRLSTSDNSHDNDDNNNISIKFHTN